MLFSSSSVVANAKFEKVESYNVYTQAYLQRNGFTGSSFLDTFTFQPGNGSLQNKELRGTYQVQRIGGQGKIYVEYYIALADGGTILNESRPTTVRIENIKQTLIIANKDDPSQRVEYLQNLTTPTVNIYYSDGSTGYASADINGDDVSITFTPSTSVQQICLIFGIEVDKTQDITDYGVMNSNGLPSVLIGVRVGEHTKDTEFLIKIEVEEESTGWLRSILDWIRGIFESIGQGFANLWSWLQSVIDTILGLPAKIWEFIEDGFYKLFVPSPDFVLDFSENWDRLLENKFGAVYEVLNLTFDSWDRIQASNEQNTITIPQTSINLPEGASFSFGGQDVRIVPQGFEWLATTIKTFVGGLCTIMFVNGLRKRYDEVMGVEQ